MDRKCLFANQNTSYWTTTAGIWWFLNPDQPHLLFVIFPGQLYAEYTHLSRLLSLTVTLFAIKRVVDYKSGNLLAWQGWWFLISLICSAQATTFRLGSRHSSVSASPTINNTAHLPGTQTVHIVHMKCYPYIIIHHSRLHLRNILYRNDNSL